MPVGIARICNDARRPNTRFYVPHSVEHCTRSICFAATVTSCASRLQQSSQTPGLKKNADGSADIFFGPTAPAGGESNWVPTDPQGRFEVLARFYGPQKALFDKTWKLSDIERAS